MVALHPVPPESTTLDPSIPDTDLVIALPPDAALDTAGAAALVEFADTDPADAWYGDVTSAGRTLHRPAWSPTRLIADPLAATPMAVRTGWLRAHDIAAGSPDLPFRLARAGADVAHITTVLSHSTETPDPPPRSVIEAHLSAIGTPATIDAEGRLAPRPDFAPDVSVVIPTAGATLDDGAVAVERLIDRLGPVPDRIELVLVVGDEFRGDPELLRGPGRTVVRRPRGPFNFSAATNLGVLHARFRRVLLLNDDAEPDGRAFIDQLALHLTDSAVAAVGGLLTYPDGTVQHAGVVIDDARPLHPFVGRRPGDVAGHGALLAREVAAVTGACLMARRADYLAVGGLSTSFPLSFNDVDLCVRLQRAVGRVIIEPAATLVHHETLTREPIIAPEEWDRWIDRWGEIVDPWYHPAYHRPDDPHRLADNADHLDPRPADPPVPVIARRPELHSRVHRGRPAAATR
jgi:hypothetical protein